MTLSLDHRQYLAQRDLLCTYILPVLSAIPVLPSTTDEKARLQRQPLRVCNLFAGLINCYKVINYCVWGLWWQLWLKLVFDYDSSAGERWHY